MSTEQARGTEQAVSNEQALISEQALSNELALGTEQALGNEQALSNEQARYVTAYCESFRPPCRTSGAIIIIELKLLTKSAFGAK